MNCPHCSSPLTTRLQRTTDLGYAMFRCKKCCRTFNERTGTPFNFVWDWEAHFAPIFVDQLRAKRQGKVGKIWFVNETYIRVKGKWCYLYRGINEDGNLVDVRLSEKRDMEAAKAFFAQAYEIVEEMPQRVITDGHTSYPRAIAEELDAEVKHETVLSDIRIWCV